MVQSLLEHSNYMTVMDNPTGTIEVTSSGAERLACHFQARNPAKYTKHGACRNGLADIPKVIEHYKRHHSPKCSGCDTTFRTVDDFDPHRNGPCPHAGEETSHLCEVQLNAIISMPKRSPGVSPAHKWEKIDHIIFDDDANMPSPFVQSLEHVLRVIQTFPPWLDGSLQASISSEPVFFLAEVKKLFYIVSRGRMTVVPNPSTPPGESGQSSRDITLPNMQYTRDTSMDMLALGMKDDEYTPSFEDIDLNLSFD